MDNFNKQIVINSNLGQEAEIKIIVRNKPKDEYPKNKRLCLYIMIALSLILNLSFFFLFHGIDPTKAASAFIAGWALCGAVIDFSNFPAGKEKNKATGALKVIPIVFMGLFYILEGH